MVRQMTATKQDNFTHVLDESLRILVVDDDPIQREFANVYLSTPTVEVVTAVSAGHARQRMRNKTFDIILVDHEMPEISGTEFVRALRADKKYADLPIIMVTSHEDIATIDNAYQAGATSFAVKPVNWRLLSYQIKYVLRAQKSLRERSAHAA